MDKKEIYVTKERATAFFDELEALCRKHDVSLSHEDYQGGFELLNFYTDTIMNWVRQAKTADSYGVRN